MAKSYDAMTEEGEKTMKVYKAMTSHPISIGPMEPVATAARLMKRHNLGALPVCDEQGRLRGILTDRDIVVRGVAADLDPADTPVRELMSRGICSRGAGEELADAMACMRREQLRRLPVLEDGRRVGIVSLNDLLRAEDCRMEAAAALSDISSNVRRPPAEK